MIIEYLLGVVCCCVFWVWLDVCWNVLVVLVFGYEYFGDLC